MWSILLSMSLLSTAPGPSAGVAVDSAVGRYASEEALRHYLTGRWLEYTGDSAGAAAELARALSLDPDAVGMLLHASESAAGAGQHGRSLELADRVLVRDAGNARASWLKGAALFNLGRAADAVPPLAAACLADSANVEYLRTLARVAEKLDRVPLVEESWSRAVRLDEDDAESWFQLATARVRMGRFGAADSALTRSLEINPIRPGAFFLRGWIRESTGNYDDAIKLYQQHLGVHSADHATRRRLALLLARQQHYAEALDQARLLSAARPDDPEAVQLEADLAYQAGRAEDGARALARLRHLAPADPEPVLRSVVVLSHHDRASEGVRLADEWAAARPHDLGALMLVARARAVTGQFDSAAARARLAVAAAPDSLEPRRLLAHALQDGHHWSDAGREWENIRQLSPDDTGVLLDLGYCREQSGDVPGALNAGRDALKLSPDSPAALNFLGYMLADHESDLPEAEQLIRRALERDPENGAYVDSFGWVLFRLGKYPEARAQLEKALVLTGGDPVIHEHLGDVYRQLRLLDRARQEYRASLVGNSANPRVKKKLEAIR